MNKSILECTFEFANSLMSDSDKEDFNKLSEEDINDILDELIGNAASDRDIIEKFDYELDDWISSYKQVIEVSDDRYIAVQCTFHHACDYDTNRVPFDYKEHIKEIYPYAGIKFSYKKVEE